MGTYQFSLGLAVSQSINDDDVNFEYIISRVERERDRLYSEYGIMEEFKWCEPYTLPAISVLCRE